MDESEKAPVERGGNTAMVLDSLHERTMRDIRSEAVSMPHRYYDIAGAVGYGQG